MTEARLDRLAAHSIVARLIKALADHQPCEIEAGPDVRRAAILLVIRERDDGEPELLMIKRAEVERDPWSGHIACPGGRMEPHDADLAATAIRETLEETGVDVVRDGRLIGQLDDLSPTTMALPPIVIRPFVAIVRDDVEIVPSEEVALSFWVPLALLIARYPWGTEVVHVRGVELSVSAFQHGVHTVWGLTERVLRQVVGLLGDGFTQAES
jgi:8-oxo-dGTP pyrophosphatase MutT (NUDIX family)